MTGLKHLCITLISPAWEPLSCKFLLDRSSGSWSFKNPVPKRELGNEEKRVSIKHGTIFMYSVFIFKIYQNKRYSVNTSSWQNVLPFHTSIK